VLATRRKERWGIARKAKPVNFSPKKTSRSNLFCCSKGMEPQELPISTEAGGLGKLWGGVWGSYVDEKQFQEEAKKKNFEQSKKRGGGEREGVKANCQGSSRILCCCMEKVNFGLGLPKKGRQRKRKGLLLGKLKKERGQKLNEWQTIIRGRKKKRILC